MLDDISDGLGGGGSAASTASGGAPSSHDRGVGGIDTRHSGHAAVRHSSGQLMESDEEDTIVAISTAIGAGAIGIVRLSGPRAMEVAGLAFRPVHGGALESADTYRLHYGHAVDPATTDVVDEVLLAVMRRPHSYTREDVVEFHCHGGVSAQRAVLRLMVGLGARPAEPGEFTRRAFLNGRIDLAQAESVAAIVAARSSGALRASLRQLEGRLSQRLKEMRRRLVVLLAGIEATVDFSDEDVEEVDWDATSAGLCAVHAELLRLVGTAFLGRALEQGVRTAIVGRPNVGKSSLLNALLTRERAIVSEIPGTTRDTVEELMEIGGIPIHLVDTAGIRKGVDDLERLGVERSVRALEEADLVLVVMDLSGPWDEGDGEFLRRVDPAHAIVVGNKADLVREDPARPARLAAFIEQQGWWRAGTKWAEGASCAEPLDHRAVCSVSALTGEGLDELRAVIQRVITGEAGLHLEEPILANERQRALVAESCARVSAAVGACGLGRDEELVCEDLRAAIGALGRVTGEDLTTDLLDEIFSRFCIGK